MTINRLDAVVMFDTGSTSDAVSPKFTQVANMKIHSLDVPMGIQLGCKGSKSKIVFSTSGPVRYGSIVGTHYFDVVNIDRFQYGFHGQVRHHPGTRTQQYTDQRNPHSHSF
jgi:hypothetical protein